MLNKKSNFLCKSKFNLSVGSDFEFRYVFEFIGYITGYDASVQKCYGFNVSNEVDKINSSLNNIESSFKNDFGNLDFSQINI